MISILYYAHIGFRNITLFVVFAHLQPAITEVFKDLNLIIRIHCQLIFILAWGGKVWDVYVCVCVCAASAVWLVGDLVYRGKKIQKS